MFGEQGNNGRRIRDDIAAINDEIHLLAKEPVNIQAAANRLFVVFELGAGVQHRIAEGLDDRQADRMIGHPDAHCFLASEHDFRDHLGPGKDEGVRAGQILPHQPVGGIADMAEITDIGQGSAHEAERFVLGPSFYLIDPFNRLLVKNIAADAIHGIRRVADYSSALQQFDNLGYQSRLGIAGVYF